MTLLRSLAAAFACFSRIPTPHVAWEAGAMRYMLCFFPLVGAVIGALDVAWLALCACLGLSTLVQGAGLALVPLAVTGGIHLDGFADVVDAQASHASPDRKREILHDPHIGSFAAMGVAAYLLAFFALACELAESVPAAGACALVPLACAPVLSRCASGIATLAFPAAKKDGMLAMERESAEKRVSLAVLGVEAAAAAGAMLLSCPPLGAACVAATAASLAWTRLVTCKGFGGMSGDVAGHLLQVAELAMLACLVVGLKAMGL